MKNFLKGIILISLLLPVIEGIITLYNQAIEFLCLKIASKSIKIKQRLEQEDIEVKTQAIGFHVPNIGTEYKDNEGE